MTNPVPEELGLVPGVLVYTDKGEHGVVVDVSYRAGRWWVDLWTDDTDLHLKVRLEEVHRAGPETY
jgi:hypothetical protein